MIRLTIFLITTSSVLSSSVLHAQSDKPENIPAKTAEEPWHPFLDDPSVDLRELAILATRIHYHHDKCVVHGKEFKSPEALVSWLATRPGQQLGRTILICHATKRWHEDEKRMTAMLTGFCLARNLNLLYEDPPTAFDFSTGLAPNISQEPVLPPQLASGDSVLFGDTIPSTKPAENGRWPSSTSAFGKFDTASLVEKDLAALEEWGERSMFAAPPLLRPVRAIVLARREETGTKEVKKGSG